MIVYEDIKHDNQHFLELTAMNFHRNFPEQKTFHFFFLTLEGAAFWEKQKKPRGGRIFFSHWN